MSDMVTARGAAPAPIPYFGGSNVRRSRVRGMRNRIDEALASARAKGLAFSTGLLALLLLGCRAPTRSLRPPADFSRYSPKEAEVRGSSMAPLIFPGTKLLILQTYYAFHPVRRGDVVAYSYAGGAAPLLKRVRALAGDRLGLREKGGCREILVNGRVLRNSAGEIYCIAKGSSARIALYARDYPVLPEKSCLLLGETREGSLDGSVFGLTSERDLEGKAVLVRH